MIRARVLVVVSAAVLALAACSKQGPNAEITPECFCTGDAVVDRTLVAFLSKARAAHHQADAAQGGGDLKQAICALQALTAGPRPSRGREIAPEVAEVIADTHARIADLESELGDFAAALRDVDMGLVLAHKPTHFRGHLFEIKGIVLERESKSLKEKHDDAGAEKAKAGALSAFETAIKIQDQVITDALSDAGP